MISELNTIPLKIKNVADLPLFYSLLSVHKAKYIPIRSTEPWLSRYRKPTHKWIAQFEYVWFFKSNCSLLSQGLEYAQTTHAELSISE